MFINLKNNLTDNKLTFKTTTIMQEKAFDEIKDWVENNLDKFNLNEEHSCIVERDGFEITISGDEDRVSLELTATIKDCIILN